MKVVKAGVMYQRLRLVAATAPTVTRMTRL